MTDAEALKELAAAIYYVQKAESKAETEKVADMLEESLDDLDQQAQEILMIIGEREYEGEDWVHNSG